MERISTAPKSTRKGARDSSPVFHGDITHFFVGWCCFMFNFHLFMVHHGKSTFFFQIRIPFKHKLVSHSHENPIKPHPVGGFNHLEKYEFVSWDDDIPNIFGKSFKINHGSSHHQPVWLYTLDEFPMFHHVSWLKDVETTWRNRSKSPPGAVESSWSAVPSCHPGAVRGAAPGGEHRGSTDRRRFELDIGNSWEFTSNF